MCTCEKPTRNDEMRGFQPWELPTMDEGDGVLLDEPGRCVGKEVVGRPYGIDYHSFHYRIVGSLKRPANVLHVRHGRGVETVGCIRPEILRLLLSMSSEERFLMCQCLYSAVSDAKQVQHRETGDFYRSAIIEKRVKVSRRGGIARVEILPRVFVKEARR